MPLFYTLTSLTFVIIIAIPDIITYSHVDICAVYFIKSLWMY